ncbi:glucose-6-phosphate isomerase [Marinobacterium sedimentorum]|uniref:glucose-6-phosphate isomerase n=1 Tax=Marinobacterium sedimentorum TaxID=2927804 RepID=UPI0020C6E6C9|nr:glucose-6-phosphate isomerase [Marinobacterium sedimentorum]MCP8690311.1 glucose-6-phosphate isomerase [Marinobacterium sedimentorum]
MKLACGSREVTIESCWQGLGVHADAVKQQHLKDLMSQDGRFGELSFRHEGMLLDLSRQRLLPQTLDKLVGLAQASDLQGWIEALFKGDAVNNTEQRPALHTALRLPAGATLPVAGEDVVPKVHANLERMAAMVELLHNRQWRGYTGEPIDTVVNVGVGGSDLGPMMACRALNDFVPDEAAHLKIHFVSSMDGSQLVDLLEQSNPATTLFIVSSKSFTTIDTLANAATARRWLQDASDVRDEVLVSRHFIAVTASPEKALQWGIPESNQLHFWDWTGGRYSLWSTIGLPIALKIGMSGFHQMLAGAHDLDRHFRSAPFSENLPVLLAMTGIWNINFLDIHAHAILPYDGRLAHLPAYLEQLEMESNGKSVCRDGSASAHRTCPVLWGEVGPNAQHAFYQLLHQGTESVMCDFIVSARRYASEHETLQRQHQLALANCLAQARVLALGDAALGGAQDNAKPWQRYRGNQPSTVILLDELTPHSVGALIALYEHKVFVQSVIWGINPFDQWGVELGKTMATQLLDVLDSGQHPVASFDHATNGLLAAIDARRMKRPDAL